MTNQPANTCDAALAVLQNRMDGNENPVDAVIAMHLRQCVDCRGRFAASNMLLAAYATKVTPDFTVRINTAVRTDARRRQARRYLMAACGLAAAIVLAIRLTLPQPSHKPDIVVAKVPSIEQRVTGARSAIWAWSGQTMSMIGLPDFSEPKLNGNDIEQSIEPAATALTNASKGLMDGVEPLTSSAKRATKRFWRELPTN